MLCSSSQRDFQAEKLKSQRLSCEKAATKNQQEQTRETEDSKEKANLKSGAFLFFFFSIFHCFVVSPRSLQAEKLRCFKTKQKKKHEAN